MFVHKFLSSKYKLYTHKHYKCLIANNNNVPESLSITHRLSAPPFPPPGAPPDELDDEDESSDESEDDESELSAAQNLLIVYRLLLVVVVWICNGADRLLIDCW